MWGPCVAIHTQVSFDAPELVARAKAEGRPQYVALITKEGVQERLATHLKSQDLSRFVI